MKFVKQFGIILVISFIGEILRSTIPLPIPASIYGLVLMFIALKTKIVPLASVKETGRFLIEIMPIMFIPAAVGLIDSWGVLEPICVPVIAITVISIVVVMVVTGLTTQMVIRLERNKTSVGSEE